MPKNISVIKQPKANWNEPVIGKYCVVTGCDSNHDWILEWWYNRYRQDNKYPVYFADFGMSLEARNWCAENGKLIDLRFRHKRKNWFKKPLAILACQYEQIIWVDSDCEIRGNLSPIFEYIRRGIGVTLDPHNPWIKSNDVVASGVVAVEHGNNLIIEWARDCLAAHKIRGDQEVLNRLIQERKREIVIMPPEYQWLRIDGDNPDALIMHWTGVRGKDYIRKSLGLQPTYYRQRVTTPRTRRRALISGAGRSKRNISKALSITKRSRRVRPLKSKPKPIVNNQISLNKPKDKR